MPSLFSRHSGGRASCGTGLRLSVRVTLRYFLLQIPGWLIGVLFVLVLRVPLGLDTWVVWTTLAVWIAKDFVLFPFVWPGYVDETPGAPGPPVGAQGAAEECLAPSGYVRVAGELWQGQALDPGRNIARGTPVRVVQMRGLTLIVAEHDATRAALSKGSAIER